MRRQFTANRCPNPSVPAKRNIHYCLYQISVSIPRHAHAFNLCKSYRYAEARQNVLEQLDLTMAASSSVALLGESGSGKSTLLHLIAGLDRPISGEIHFDGHRHAYEPGIRTWPPRGARA